MKKKYVIIMLFLLMLILKPYIQINYSDEIEKNTLIGSYTFGYCTSCGSSEEYVENAGIGTVHTVYCSGCDKFLRSEDCEDYAHYCCYMGDSCSKCGVCIHSGLCHKTHTMVYCCENGQKCNGRASNTGSYVYYVECDYKDHTTCHNHSYEYDSNGSSGHTVTCSCGINETESHSMSTCCYNGSKCSECGYSDHTCHTCSYTSSYSSTGDSTHTAYCVCGNYTTKNHTLTTCCANGQKCSYCSYKDHDACHTHSYTSRYSSYGNGGHYAYCSCGEYQSKSHTIVDCCYSGDKCSYCNYKDHTTCHSCSYTSSYSSTGDSTHTAYCVCGKSTSKSHTMIDCCYNGDKCSYCSYKDHATCHSCSYSSATCYQPATCVCGKTSGSKVAHDYSGSLACNVNGATDTQYCKWYGSGDCTATNTITCIHSIAVTVKSTTGGTASGSTTCKPGTKVAISAQRNIGYNFSSWSTTGGTLENSLATSTNLITSNSDIVVTAQFTLGSYTLTINPNGGTWQGNAAIAQAQGAYGETVDIENPINYDRGYTVTFNAGGGSCEVASLRQAMSFVNWTFSGVGSMSDKVFTYAEGDATITAQYVMNPITLPTSTYGSNKFDGWYTSDGTKIGDAGVKYEPTADITLYAKWKAATPPEITVEGPTPTLIGSTGTTTYTLTLNEPLYLIDKTKFVINGIDSTGMVTVSDIDQATNKIIVTVKNNGTLTEGSYNLVVQAGAIYDEYNNSSYEKICEPFKVGTTISGEIRYSTTSPTKGGVVATFVPNYGDNSEGRTMWIDGQTGFSHIFTENGEYVFNVVDSLGNRKSFVAKVDWIVSGQGTISIDYDVISGGTIFTKILLKTDKNWKINTSNPVELEITNSSGTDVTQNAKITVISVKEYSSTTELADLTQKFNAGTYHISLAIGGAFVDPTKIYTVNLKQVNIIDADTLESTFVNGLNQIEVEVYDLLNLD